MLLSEMEEDDDPMAETQVGPAVPVMGTAYRLSELLTELRELRPERSYSLLQDRDRPRGNLLVKVRDATEKRDMTVKLPTRLKTGRWILTGWQYLELEVEFARKRAQKKGK